MTPGHMVTSMRVLAVCLLLHREWLLLGDMHGGRMDRPLVGVTVSDACPTVLCWLGRH